jgi:hypothetical protein
MLAFELAYFYGWTLQDVRLMTMSELDIARSYMIEMRKQQGGENGR